MPGLIALLAALASTPIDTGVPAAFTGMWAYSREACAAATDDTRLVITRSALQFHESGGPIEGVIEHGPGDVTFLTTLTGEGETHAARLRFRLSPDGQALADVSDGENEPFVRYRCSEGASAPTSAPPKLPMVMSVQWVRRPSVDQMLRIYPTAALSAGVSGRVTLECSVMATGALEDCSVIRDSAPGHGIGDASLAASKYFRMREKTPDGRSVGGARVRLSISWVP